MAVMARLLTLYLNNEFRDVEARELVSFQAGLEYRWTDRLSVLGQLFYTSPMTSDYDIEEFNSQILDMAIGVSWGDADGPRGFAAFQEDLVAATGPDFGLMFGVVWGF